MAAACGPSPLPACWPPSPATCCSPSSLVCIPPSLPFAAPTPTVPLVCSPPPPPPVTARCQPAPAIPSPPVTVSALICSSQSPIVTTGLQPAVTVRHRETAPAIPLPPVTTGRLPVVTACHRHHLPVTTSRPVTNRMTVHHRFHLDGDGELHTGGITCYRPPAALPAAFGSLQRRKICANICGFADDTSRT